MIHLTSFHVLDINPFHFFIYFFLKYLFFQKKKFIKFIIIIIIIIIIMILKVYVIREACSLSCYECQSCSLDHTLNMKPSLCRKEFNIVDFVFI